MDKAPFLRMRTLRSALLALLCIGTLLSHPRGQTTIEAPSDPPAPIILEVINTHFTVGEKIPSGYLRVFSDRTVECQALNNFGDETGVVKRKVLTREELKKIQGVVDQP